MKVTNYSKISFLFIFFIIPTFILAQLSPCCNSNGLLGFQDNHIEKRYPFYNRLFLRGNSFLPGTQLGSSYGYNPNIPQSPFLYYL